MAEGYTELFFMDEATALASGHRPCFQCRYKDATRFATLFGGGPPRSYVADMDKQLHQERRAERDLLPAQSLPDGVIFRLGEQFYLRWQGQMQRWQFTGYGPPEPLPSEAVAVMTPASIRQVLAIGYRPMLHSSV